MRYRTVKLIEVIDFFAQTLKGRKCQ